MSIVVATAISTDYVNWDEISRDFMPTNEVSRAYLASFILVMDLFIVMQVQLDCSLTTASSTLRQVNVMQSGCIKMN